MTALYLPIFIPDFLFLTTNFKPACVGLALGVLWALGTRMRFARAPHRWWGGALSPHTEPGEGEDKMPSVVALSQP